MWSRYHPGSGVCCPASQRQAASLAGAGVVAAAGLSGAVLSVRAHGSRRVVRARQAAIYLAHVGFGLSQRQTAVLYGRDRATVRHACACIEGLRDCARFDRAFDCLEAALRVFRGSLPCALPREGGHS